MGKAGELVEGMMELQGTLLLRASVNNEAYYSARQMHAYKNVYNHNAQFSGCSVTVSYYVYNMIFLCQQLQ